MKRKLNKKHVAITIIGVLVFSLMISSVFYMTSTKKLITFKKDKTVEIYSENFNPLNYISKIKDKGSIEDVTVDDSEVDLTKLGSYNVTYSYEGKDYTTEIEVVDSVSPKVEVKDYMMTIGDSIEAEDLVTKVEDATDTTIKFKKNYKFNKIGEYDTTIVVTDEGNNKTEKEAKVTVFEEDTIAPDISGVSNITAYIGGKVKYLSGISAKDARDGNVKVTVEHSAVNLKKKGKYEITYTASDKAGNTATKKCYVIVKKKPSLKSCKSSDEKVVYLTFDDGPSKNTEAILKVLKEYNVQATFFVTAQNKEYLDLLKDEYDDGHTIAIHSYSHKWSIYKSQKKYYKDLKKMQDIIYEKTGSKSYYIRFPGGSSNTMSKHYKKGIMKKLCKSLLMNGYQYYDWNVDSGDAAGNNVSAKKLVKNIKKAPLYNNIMILMHDAATKSTTVKALPKIIEYYQKKGYTFKAIDNESFVCHHQPNN